MNGLFRPEWSTLKKLMFLQSASGGSYETITGNPVSFSAKAAPLKQLSVAFSPVQDLNGYDSPWPAGGGKNKMPPLSEWVDGYVSSNGTISSPSSTYQEKTSPFISIDGWTGSVAFSCVGSFPHTQAGYAWRAVGYYSSADVSGFISRSASGTDTNLIEAIPTGAKYVRACCRTFGETLQLQLENSSTATSYAPYSNLCPISGWSSLTVEQTGKNLAEDRIVGGSIGSTGEIGTGGSYDMVYGRVKSGATYTVTTNDSQLVCGFFESKPSAGSTSYNGARLVQSSKTFTAPIDGWVAFRANTGYEMPMLVLGSEAPAEYVPYNPSSRSISISLGQTVYSGTIDVVTGQGEVTWAAVDLGSLTWTYYAQYAFFQSSAISGIITQQTSGVPPFVLCSIYEPVGNYGLASLGDLPDMTVTMRNTYQSCTTKDSRYTDPEAYKTAMSGVQLVYELATPIPISLTPQEINSLAGDNVLFSDANGDLTVTYRSN